MVWSSAFWSILPKRARESQYEVVCRHWDYIGGGQASVLRQHIEVVNIADAPLSIFGTKRGIELRIARRGVLAAALERPQSMAASAPPLPLSPVHVQCGSERSIRCGARKFASPEWARQAAMLFR